MARRPTGRVLLAGRAVFAFPDNRIISNDVGLVVNKENDDIGAILSLPLSPSIPLRSPPSSPAAPRLTTMTAVAGMLRWITGNLRV